jgi:serine phosphatase RsbU (regulator of sigma subunit)
MLKTPEQPATPKGAFEQDDSDLNIRSDRKLETELSVERALRERAQRTASLLWRLQSLTAAFAGAMTTDQIADAVVDTGLAAMDAQSGALALSNEEGTELTIVRAAGYRSDIETEWRTFGVSEALPLSEAVRTHELVLLESIEQRDTRYPLLAKSPTPNQSFACVPLIVKGRALGGLTYSFEEARLFGDDDRSFLLALGQLTAQALERARLYEAEHEALARAEAAAERLRFLARASETLTSSMDYRLLLERLAEAATEWFTDWCVIDVVRRDRSIERTVITGRDSKKAALVAEVDTLRRYPSDPEASLGVRRVIETGQWDMRERIEDAWLEQEARGQEDYLAMLRSLDLRSMLCVPLRAGDRILGALTFVTTGEGRSFGPIDLALAQELAFRASSALEHARLFEERTHISRTLQQSLLPPHLPEIPGADVAARYHAAGEGYEVGGDFYDLFKTARGDWAIVLGDVCGKGADAAATTALARHTLRAAAMQTRKPHRVLGLLNEAMLRAEQPFCTVAYARFQKLDGGARLTVACGGHPLTFVIRAGGAITTFGQPGTLIGAFEQPALQEETLDLHAGDAVVLYTDGVTEARNDSAVLGESGLRAALVRSANGSADEIADAIKQAALDFQNGDARDDIAIVVVKIRAPHS